MVCSYCFDMYIDMRLSHLNKDYLLTYLLTYLPSRSRSIRFTRSLTGSQQVIYLLIITASSSHALVHTLEHT